MGDRNSHYQENGVWHRHVPNSENSEKTVCGASLPATKRTAWGAGMPTTNRMTSDPGMPTIKTVVQDRGVSII